MDPICEEKYNFLQKYVPFLANLIELLANDAEKQGKLAQMQLLYNLLNKPDNSVQIETLEKCEEVLCRVFGNTEENKNDEDEWVMPSPLIKAELPDEPDESLEQVDEDYSENLNGSLEHTSDVETTTTQNTSLPIEDSTKEEQSKSNAKEKNEISELEKTENSELERSEKKKLTEESNQDESIQESLSESNPAEEVQKENAIDETSNVTGIENISKIEKQVDAGVEVEKEILPDTRNELKEENEVKLSNPSNAGVEDVVEDIEEDISKTRNEDKKETEVQSSHKANAGVEDVKEDLSDKKDEVKEATEIKISNEAEAKDVNQHLNEAKEENDTQTTKPEQSVKDDSLEDENVPSKALEETNDIPQPIVNNESIEDPKLNSSPVKMNITPDKTETKKMEIDEPETPSDSDNVLAPNSVASVDNVQAVTVVPNDLESSSSENSKAVEVASKGEDYPETKKKETDVKQSNDNLGKLDFKESETSTCVSDSKAVKNDSKDEMEKPETVLIGDVEGVSMDGNINGSIDEDLGTAATKPEDREQNGKKSENADELVLEEELSSDVIRQSQTEMLTFKIVSAESLAATQILPKIDETLTDSTNTQSKHTAKETSTSDPLDPLSHSPEKKIIENGGTPPKVTNNKDDDDDDVLLVETRSSPICIDSDPEDEENMKGNRSLPIIPTKIPQLRNKLVKPKPYVRKSTSAVMDQIRHIINKNQKITARKKFATEKNLKAFRETAFVKKDPKALMETIDLLDSDSEDERSKNNCKNTKTKANTDDDVIIVSSTQPKHRVLTKKSYRKIPSGQQMSRLPTKMVNKSPQKPATAQSNFLNAVNLQPAPKSNSSNPATFCAQLSNKKVLIPNAFYGNPSYNRKSSSSTTAATQSKTNNTNPDESSNDSSVATAKPPPRTVGVHSGVGIRHVQDKVLKEWLEGFLTNFASPLQIASHACFVLLQRVLKYRFFQRLKETRLLLNESAKNSTSGTVDVQLLLDLQNVFLENDYLTEAGRRFCRFATNDAFGKAVALTTDSNTGRVTCRTRIASKNDLPTDILRTPNTSIVKTTKPIAQEKPTVFQSPTPASYTKPIVHSTKTTASLLPNPSPPSAGPKRRGKYRKLSDGLVVAVNDEDDNDYTPAIDEIEPEAEIVTERKRSLRTNRTKRKEAGFTYSEDHDDEEFEALAKKIEDKKREELRLAEEREEMERELEQQQKATKKTVAKKTTSKRQGGQLADNQKGPTRKKLRLANTSIVGAEDNDLLTPTWIEADGDDAEVDSLLDFADEPQSPYTNTNPVSENDNTYENSEDGTTEETSQQSSEAFDVDTKQDLKNTDRNMHFHCKTHDFCVHCHKRVNRIVHHYVNEHRSSEVFPSRLRNRDVRRLLTTSNLGFVHLYKGNQQQYAAHCIFCDKEAKFLLPYWFEHFTMHTGEYSFKCSGCHIMKPTRSLLTNHIQSNTGCPKKGKAVRLVNFDTKVHQIEGHICSICNYTQIHRKNLLRHLRTQHGIDTISPKHIIKVVLLQISAPYGDQDTVTNDESQLSLLQASDDENNGVNNDASLDENSLMMQHDFTDNDDLSFMICGMLDVQTNLSSTGGGYSVNMDDTTNNVDNE